MIYQYRIDWRYRCLKHWPTITNPVTADGEKLLHSEDEQSDICYLGPWHYCAQCYVDEIIRQILSYEIGSGTGYDCRE
jgi:hypothetical protein